MTTPIASRSTPRILVAIDGSPPSQWAIVVAKRFAGQLKARVRLVHVVEPSLPIYEDYMASQEIETRRARYGLGLLKESRLLFSPNVETDSILRTGLAFEEIAREAREWDATLIVMGTHGRNWLADIVLGNTAADVMRRAACPVVVVSHAPKCEPALAPDSVGVGVGVGGERVHAGAG